MAIDTLGYAKALEDAGVERKQAEAHAFALRTAVDGGLATKADITAVRSEIASFKAAVKSDFDALRSDTKAFENRIEAMLWKHTVGILLGVLAIGGLLIRFLR